MENTRIFKDNNIELIYDYTENILFWIDESKAIEFKVICEDELKNFTNKLFTYFKYDYYKALNIYEDVKNVLGLVKRCMKQRKILND